MNASIRSTKPGEITCWSHGSTFAYRIHDSEQQRLKTLYRLRVMLSTEEVLGLTGGWSKKLLSILVQDLREVYSESESEDEDEEEGEFYYGEAVGDSNSSDSEPDLFGL